MVTIFGVAEGDPEAVELTEEDSSAETHVSEDPQSNKQKKNKNLWSKDMSARENEVLICFGNSCSRPEYLRRHPIIVRIDLNIRVGLRSSQGNHQLDRRRFCSKPKKNR